MEDFQEIAGAWLVWGGVALWPVSACGLGFV